MGFVRQYARSRLREGEQLWWLEDINEQAHSLPIAVRFFRHLEATEKRRLRAEATLLCPEIVRGGRVAGKYDRAGLYFLLHYGVFASHLRDLFTAGSVGARGGQTGHKYLPAATKDIEEEIKVAAQNLDDALFQEYWGESCPPEERIQKWIRHADRLADDWRPSEVLFTEGING